MRAFLALLLVAASAMALQQPPKLSDEVAAAAAVVEKAADGAAAAKSAATPVRANVTESFPPRHMWGWGPGLTGYCGETSFQMAGLRHGNYISSDALRWNGAGGELLLAVNDEKAATWAHFAYSTWDWRKSRAPQAENFKKDFVKKHVDANATVVVGVYERLPEDIADEDYDHIVPVAGYNADGDNISVAIFDLYTDYPRPVAVADRTDFTQTHEPEQPFDYALPLYYDYGIAIKGNKVDQGVEVLPVELTLPHWKEPDYSMEDGRHEAVVEWQVGVSIRGLTSGKQYSLLRFNNAALVPHRDFLKGAYASRVDFTATGETHSLTAEIRTDATVFYRCVPTV